MRISDRIFQSFNTVEDAMREHEAALRMMRMSSAELIRRSLRQIDESRQALAESDKLLRRHWNIE